MDLFGKKSAKRVKELEKLLDEKSQETEKVITEKNQELEILQKKLDSLGYSEYTEAKAEVARLNQEIAQNNDIISRLRDEIQDLEQRERILSKQNQTATNKLAKSKELYKSTEYAISRFFESDPRMELCKLTANNAETYDLFVPSVTLKLHVMDIKSLRKAYRDNDKQIESILTKYAARYTTKANQAIYQLMVIALRAELQNILYNLKYEKLDIAIDQVKNVTAKYLSIATEGNQSIAGTMTKFIGQVEYLFINAVKIEYNYYVKKEQARQEQIEIRAKMRQEVAERKALEAERKKIETEENKYSNEIERIKEQIEGASDDEAEQLKNRILALEAKLSDVLLKKEEITNLQNGKAGNIYIISNLGSFGENVFKIGMTRRLDPQDRIDELGSASVPFKFDVHSLIFSDDAVTLENRLHSVLNNKRVNKVNLRKEFFYSTIDELEALVLGIDPTAEFNRTMLAEEFRQSQSTDEVYTSSCTFAEEGDE